MFIELLEMTTDVRYLVTRKIMFNKLILKKKYYSNI